MIAAFIIAAGLSACGQGGTAAGSAAATEAAAPENAGNGAGGAGEKAAGEGAENAGAEAGNAAESAAAETHPVLGISPGGAQFPDMNIVVPTTEPAPEYIRIGTKSWIVKDLQARLMELGFMDNDEPTDYYGEVTEAAVKIYQRSARRP